MKILHCADIHLAPQTRVNVAPAMARVLELAREHKPDLIVNAGDLSFRRGYIEPGIALDLRRFHVELAEIAPTIVVPGNHDLPGDPASVGTVRGVLEESAADHQIHLFERPSLIGVAGRAVFYLSHGLRPAVSDGVLYVACLPYPSKHWLLANRPELSKGEINEAMSAALLDVVRGLAAQIPAGERAILVYHGSIAGARTDSEMSMTTEIDVVLNEADVPPCFEAILCGHIHKHQAIGRAVYSGSLAPLTFAEEKSAHGVVLWTLRNPEGWSAEHLPIAPAVPLRTLDLREQRQWVNEGLQGAKVRARVKLAPGEDAATVRAQIAGMLRECGAVEVHVEAERAEEQRASVEVRGDMGLEHLLDLYAERHPDVAEILPAVKAHAAEMEGRLPPEAALRLISGGYRLIELRLDNWKSLGEGNVLDFSNGAGPLISLDGQNAAGKSNAAEGEAFALWGEFVRPGRTSLADAVRIGAKECRVVAFFEAAGRDWKVERRIRVNSKGVGSQDLSLYRHNGVTKKSDAMMTPEQREAYVADTWEPASRGSARETQAYIEQLVGSFGLYKSTRYAAQGDIDRLCNLTPSETTETFQEALATDVFEAREAVGRVALVAAERAAERHELGLSAWREIANPVTVIARGADVAETGYALDMARQVVRAVGQAHVDAAFALAEAQRSLAATAERQATWDAAARSAADARERVEALESEANALRVALEESEQARAELEKLPAAREALEAARKANAEAMVREANRERAEADANRTAADLVAHDRDAKRAIEEASAWIVREEVAAKKAATSGDQRIEAAQRQAGLLARVPFGEKCVEAGCQFVADAVKAREGFSTLRAEVQAENDAHAVTLGQLREKKAALVTESAGKREVLEAAARTALLRLEALPVEGMVDLYPLEQEVARLEALRPKVDAAADQRARLAAKLDTFEMVVVFERNYREALEALGERPDADRETAEVEVLVESCDAALAELGRARLAETAAVDDHAQARARLEQAEEAQRHLEAAGAETARLTLAAQVARAYLAAVARNGLPYLMLERALPSLEAHANHFLCAEAGTGLRVEIDALRELRSGETRSEVVIRYANDFGVHPLSAASGAERTRLGYALRVALARLQAEARGIEVSLVILDEGFGVFDETNLLVAQEMLRRIASWCGTVVVISHQAPVKEVCDTRWRVIADHENGSRIETGVQG